MTWLTPLRALMILVLLGCVAYGNAVNHPLVHDDLVFITQNANITRWNDLIELFVHPQINSPDLAIANSYYRPLLEVLYKVEYFLFTDHAWGYHLINIILHIANAFLVFLFLLQWTKRKALSFVVGVLFLIHPIQTEAVSCVAGVSNLLLSFFLLMSLYFYVLSGHQQKISFYVTALIFFVLALLTKEQAMVLPVLVILVEIFNETKTPSKQFKGVMGFLVLAGGMLLFRSLILKFPSLGTTVFNNELPLRLLSISQTLLMDLRILIFPLDLHYYRCVDILEPFFWPTVFLTIVIVTFVWVLKALSASERRLALFGIFWFLITLLPVLNIIPLVVEYSYVMAMEHFLYLPSVGFLIVGALGLQWFIRKLSFVNSQQLLVWIFVGVALLSLSLTIRQNTFWRGQIPLFERTLKYEKELGRVHLLLAQAYALEGRTNDAQKEYDLALAIMDNYARKASSPETKTFYLNFMKTIHLEKGMNFQNRADFDRAIREFEFAVSIDSRDDVLYNVLGIAYLQKGNDAGAIESFQKAVSLNPKNVQALSNLAVVYLQMGREDIGERYLRQTLAIDPHFRPAQENLKKLLIQKTKLQKATLP